MLLSGCKFLLDALLSFPGGGRGNMGGFRTRRTGGFKLVVAALPEPADFGGGGAFRGGRFVFALVFVGLEAGARVSNAETNCTGAIFRAELLDFVNPSGRSSLGFLAGRYEDDEDEVGKSRRPMFTHLITDFRRGHMMSRSLLTRLQCRCPQSRT